jgi:mono/diheme cytochrome c family protein
MKIPTRGRVPLGLVAIAAAFALAAGCLNQPKSVATNPAVDAYKAPSGSFKDDVKDNADALFTEGQKIFRYDTFGSEAFWGDQLQLHRAIAGEKLGGVGPGLTAKQALELGIKADIAKLPRILMEAIKGGHVSLDKTETTIELLKADAVVGVKAIVNDGKVTSVGITCALCHSTVDDSFAKGIGRRLDGWPNRDLNVGAVVALAPNLKPYADLLGKNEDEVRKILQSWGPGRYDAELDKDGKAFQPDGRSAATVMPAAFGLAGQNLHTYTGWGSVPYWNAYVGITQMHGVGTFFDPRLNDSNKFPNAVRVKTWNIRPAQDLVTAKLPALHYYQLSIPAPKPKPDSFDAGAAQRGKTIFNGKAKCATCHVPPLYSEPGYPLHKGAEIGIDDFQANRSPTGGYRTTPLQGLFVHEKGGFYHDGRFADYAAVIDHYQPVLNFQLTSQERNDLIQFLKSL